jgi:hypothetical protein
MDVLTLQCSLPSHVGARPSKSTIVECSKASLLHSVAFPDVGLCEDRVVAIGAPSAGVRTPRRPLLRLPNRAAAGEKETPKRRMAEDGGGWRRMAEIDEAGAGDEESTPPSLTPVCIRSSSRFMLLLVSFICVFIDPCEHQLRPEIRRDKINNFATFTNGTGARHSGRVATNRDVHSFLIVCRG